MGFANHPPIGGSAPIFESIIRKTNFWDCVRAYCCAYSWTQTNSSLAAQLAPELAANPTQEQIQQGNFLTLVRARDKMAKDCWTSIQSSVTFHTNPVALLQCMCWHDMISNPRTNFDSCTCTIIWTWSCAMASKISPSQEMGAFNVVALFTFSSPVWIF